MVNEQILNGLPVDVRMMPIDQARAAGAMALFSEKYGDIVRVVSMGEFSRELCGGTHLCDTSRMGLFRIVSESSVAAGVRRIECVTGFGVLEQLDTADGILKQAAHILKSSTAEVAVRAGALHEELRSAQKEIAALNQKARRPPDRRDRRRRKAGWPCPAGGGEALRAGRPTPCARPGT